MTLGRRALVVCPLILLLTAASARAGIYTAMVPLGRHEVSSKNGLFVLEVDPEAQRNSVYHRDDRTRPVWSFSRVLTTDVRKILLADDGSVVALIGGGGVSSSNLWGAQGVWLIDRDGETRSHRIVEFNRGPTFSAGCGGEVAIWYDEVVDQGNQFIIRTPDGKEHTLEYTTGSPFWRGRSLAVFLAMVGLVVAGYSLWAGNRTSRVARSIANAP